MIEIKWFSNLASFCFDGNFAVIDIQQDIAILQNLKTKEKKEIKYIKNTHEKK